MGIKHLIAKATCLLVGNGDSIRTWSDLWIPDLLSFTLTPKVYANPNIALVVSHLLTPNQSSWDISKLRLLFKEHVVDLIQKIPIPSCPMKVGLGLQQTLGYFLSSQLIGFVGKALLPQTLTILGVRFGNLKFMST